MNYIGFYQKQYRKCHKEHIKALQQELYDLYKTEYIPCIFCHRLVQLNTTNLHLKTKKCKLIQDKIENYDELMIKHKQKINDIKCNLRLSIEQNTECQTV